MTRPETEIETPGASGTMLRAVGVGMVTGYGSAFAILLADGGWLAALLAVPTMGTVGLMAAGLVRVLHLARRPARTKKIMQST